MELEKFQSRSEIEQLLKVRERISDLRSDLDRRGGVRPRVDLIDHGDAFELIVEVPGVRQEHLEVAVQGRDLIVAGLVEPLDDHLDVITAERPSGHFQRQVELPSEVQWEDGTAHLREGLLIVHLPKP